jgi:hypothetical protein
MSEMKAEMGKTTDGTVSYLHIGDFYVTIQKDGDLFFTETLQIGEIRLWELFAPGERGIDGYAQVDGKQANF